MTQKILSVAQCSPTCSEISNPFSLNFTGWVPTQKTHPALLLGPALTSSFTMTAVRNSFVPLSVDQFVLPFPVFLRGYFNRLFLGARWKLLVVVTLSTKHRVRPKGKAFQPVSISFLIYVAKFLLIIRVISFLS